MEISSKAKAVEYCSVLVKGTHEEVNTLKGELKQSEGVHLKGVNMSIGKMKDMEKDENGELVLDENGNPNILGETEYCLATFNLIVDLEISKGLDLVNSLV